MYYIVNFKKNKGFVILAADKRSMPILAFSETGFFENNSLNSGLSNWMNKTIDYVENQVGCIVGIRP